MKMLWPSGKVYMSTCGLMLIFLTSWRVFSRSTWISLSKWPMLQTMAWSFIFCMCSSVMMSHVAGGGDVDVAAAERVFHRGDFEAFHRGLQRVDRIDLGDDHARAQAAQRVRRALADIAVAADHRDLAGHHHVGGALDAVGQRFAAAVQVVELGLGDRVVHVDRGHQQLALLPASCRGDARRWWSLRKRRAIPSPGRASAAGSRRGPSSAGP